MEGQKQEDERSYPVTESELRAIQQTVCDADRATDRAFANLLRHRSQGLAEFLAYAREQLTEIGPKVWMVEELLELVENERDYLAELALKIVPPEGTS